MNQFNLTEWALKHKQFIYFFVILSFIAGLFSYKSMGRAEDPDFVIKQMKNKSPIKSKKNCRICQGLTT